VEPEVKLEEDLQPVIGRSFDSEAEPAQTDAQAEPDTESGELEVSIEGDSPPPEVQQDSAPFRELRRAHREEQKARKAAEAKLAELANPKQDLGPKPTLESVDYDADAFESALLSWNERKRQADSELAKQQEAQKAEQQVFAERLDRYNAEKRALRIANYEEAEAAVTETLNTTQQSVLVRYFDKPALLVAAIGKNPETAKTLAAIKDPIEFAFAVRDLESKVKTTPRKPPAPEARIATTGRSVSTDARLKELQAEADRTGDRTKLMQFHRAQKA